MKRKISMLFVVVIAILTLTACGKFECDWCGKEKSGKAYTVSSWGEKSTICKECKNEMNELKNWLEEE